MTEPTLYQVCPDCNGNGFIEHMAANPTLDETVEDCTRCVQWQGMVPVESEEAWLTLEDIGPSVVWIVHHEEQPDFMAADHVMIVGIGDNG